MLVSSCILQQDEGGGRQRNCRLYFPGSVCKRQGQSNHLWSWILVEDEISWDPFHSAFHGFYKPPVQRFWLWVTQSRWRIASPDTDFANEKQHPQHYRWSRLSPELPCFSGISQAHNGPLNIFFFSVVKFFISCLSSRELLEIIANMHAQGSHNCWKVNAVYSVWMLPFSWPKKSVLLQGAATDGGF